MADLAQLLEMSRGSDPAALLRAALDSDSISPARRPLIEMMLATQQSAEILIEDDDDPDEGRLVEQLRAQQAILSDLAGAIGACPACFGADEDCDDCGGAGSPGAFMPRRDAFEFFVRPAIERVSRRSGPRPRRPAQRTGPSTKE